MFLLSARSQRFLVAASYDLYNNCSLLFLNVLLICSSLDPAIVPTAIPGYDPVTQSKCYCTRAKALLTDAFVSGQLY